MSETVESEIEAIRAVLSALLPLSQDTRMHVLEYVMRRLGITGPSPAGSAPPPIPGDETIAAHRTPAPVAHTHIKELKSQKKPRSANEMAALVAYYLGSVAPKDERKHTVNYKDIETYFKIGEFRLPEQIRMTLPNAKNAGYFDSAGDGEYRLNAVGYNLVAHSMPRGAAAERTRTAVRPGRSARRASVRIKKPR